METVQTLQDILGGIAPRNAFAVAFLWHYTEGIWKRDMGRRGKVMRSIFAVILIYTLSQKSVILWIAWFLTTTISEYF